MFEFLFSKGKEKTPATRLGSQFFERTILQATTTELINSFFFRFLYDNLTAIRCM